MNGDLSLHPPAQMPAQKQCLLLLYLGNCSLATALTNSHDTLHTQPSAALWLCTEQISVPLPVMGPGVPQ